MLMRTLLMLLVTRLLLLLLLILLLMLRLPILLLIATAADASEDAAALCPCSSCSSRVRFVRLSRQFVHPTTSARVRRNEGVPCPDPHLLFPRHLQFAESTEDYIFKDVCT